MTPLTLAEIAAGEAECRLDPITPEAIWNDTTLTDEQRARAFDLLFEDDGSWDDEPW